MRKPVVAGIDLAGSNKRPTGLAFLKGRKILGVSYVFTDDEIVSNLKKYRPMIIGIDAPLTLPKGRPSIGFRDCLLYTSPSPRD